MLVPNNIINNKNLIYLSKNGEYVVEAGDSEIGVLIRIDNFLESFDKFIIKEEEKLGKLELRKQNILDELEKEIDFLSVIHDLQDRIKQVNDKLGVKENE